MHRDTLIERVKLSQCCVPIFGCAFFILPADFFEAEKELVDKFRSQQKKCEGTLSGKSTMLVL